MLLPASPSLDAAELALKDFEAETALTALDQVENEGALDFADHVRFYALSGIAHGYLEHKEESLARMQQPRFS